jgi:transcriptional regulator with XRE-family HTH domain
VIIDFSGSAYRCPVSVSAAVQYTTDDGTASSRLGTDLIGLKIASGSVLSRISSNIDGPIALPIPQKNIPSLAVRSSSFRDRILPIDWPASTPNLVQQKHCGIGITSPFHAEDAVICSRMQTDSAKVLKEARLDQGLSQKVLAKRMGISQSTVSRREKKTAGKYSKASHKLRTYSKRTGRKKLLNSLRIAKKQLEAIWKSSPAQAATISKIIEAFAELRDNTGRNDRIRQ